MATAFAQRRDPTIVAIESFLDRHALPCTKQTLFFAFLVATDENVSIQRTATAHLNAGGKITPEWISKRLSELGPDRPRHPGAPAKAPKQPPITAAHNSEKTGPDLLQQMDGLGNVISSLLSRASEDTSDFAGALRQSEEALKTSAPKEVIRDLAWRVKGALVRQGKTERQLSNAREKISSLKEALKRAEHEAQVDPLTRLANRRGLAAKLTELGSNPISSSVALIDIDHFKRINDRFGHPAGDEVLKALSRHLQATLPGCFISRHGGEEFAVVLPQTGLRHAFEKIEYSRVRLREQRIDLALDGNYVEQLSFSAGIAPFGPGTTYADVMRSADEELYRAKRAGRGRTVYR